jgi:hypothetical protein
MYVMKRYTISQARERLADVLNEAEQNGSVAIERRGVRYVIRPETTRQKRKGGPAIEVVDPAVAEGRWGWTVTPTGVRFVRRRRRS